MVAQKTRSIDGSVSPTSARNPNPALGGPAVLMTRVPGKMQLMPRDRERWLRQMAQMLVRIHALAVDGKPFESWLDRSQLSPPPDASRADIWREAIALVAEWICMGASCSSSPVLTVRVGCPSSV